MGKFKVWDNRDKCFVENSKCGNLLKNEFFYLNHVGELFYFNPALFDKHGPEKCGDGEYTTIHSTGKTDKNGVELFDGDIVKASIYEGEDEQILEIQCRNNVFVIDYDDGDIDCFLVGDFPGIIEKIGNKFENTELSES